jgi:sugar lactone lactonase YvrE
VRFNSAGQTTRTIRAAISSASGDSELDTRVAADGLGNIYALGTFNNAVFKFTADGKFANRFGSAGGQPGQFRAPEAIAVDGKGRVYVSDIKGIQLFDADGRYLQVFKPEGLAFGMVFNDKNELFIAARNHVIKFVLNQ